jgi:hypothetical protein
MILVRASLQGVKCELNLRADAVRTCSARALWPWIFSRAVPSPSFHTPGLPVRAVSMYAMHGLIDSLPHFADCVLTVIDPKVQSRVLHRWVLEEFPVLEAFAFLCSFMVCSTSGRVCMLYAAEGCA